MNREEFLELSQKNWDEAARLYSQALARVAELANHRTTMPDEWMAEASHWVAHRIDDLTKFLAEACRERDALRAKNKALAQQFLDADGYVVELRARVAELERLGNEIARVAEIGPLDKRPAIEAWRKAVPG